MSDRIKRLAEELKAHLKAVQDISETAERDNGGDFTEEQRATVSDRMEKARATKKQLDEAKADDEVRAAVRSLGDEVGLVDAEAERKDRQDRVTDSGLLVPGRKSIGSMFTESDSFQALLKTAPNGQFARDMRVQSNPVGFKALVTGVDQDSAGAVVESDRRGIVNGLAEFARPLTLRSLVTPGSTTSDSIEYPRFTGFVNAAAPVAEATTTDGPTANTTTGALEPAAGGGYKPESSVNWTRITTPVRTIAHWIPVTKRALSDAAQIRTLIDQFLQYGLEEELEDQMIAGDGTGENFEGMETISGIQTQALVPDPTGKPEGFGRLLTLRRAKTRVRLGGRAAPTGYVLNPADLETLDEISNMDGNFYFGGPAGANGTAPLWGLPVVESEAVPAGTAWVGDWRKAILWDREQSSITVTDSHSDFFVRNLVAILAEMRAAFGVIQPSAFVRISLTA